MSRRAARQPYRKRPAAAPRLLGLPRNVALALAGLVVVLLAAGAAGSLATRGGGASGETIVQGRGGHWTDVTPDRLAEMLRSKGFTLVNVKTPYVGEIAGTDLYVPYDQLTSRQGQLPQDRAAKIVVYCKTGRSSAIAAQTLLDLGYTNVWNLAGGMDAWQASGRPLVTLDRS